MREETVLVIDDDPRLRETLETVLREEGWNTETAESGVDGLEKALKLEPDLILLDYQLPDIDGLEVLEGLRQANLEIPVVVITGRGDEKIATRFLTQGAVDYLPKALLTPVRLTRTLEQALWIVHGDPAPSSEPDRAPAATPEDVSKPRRLLLLTEDAEIEDVASRALAETADDARILLVHGLEAALRTLQSQEVVASVVDLRGHPAPTRALSRLVDASPRDVLAVVDPGQQPLPSEASSRTGPRRITKDELTVKRLLEVLRNGASDRS